MYIYIYVYNIYIYIFTKNKKEKEKKKTENVKQLVFISENTSDPRRTYNAISPMLMEQLIV